MEVIGVDLFGKGGFVVSLVLEVPSGSIEGSGRVLWANSGVFSFRVLDGGPLQRGTLIYARRR